MTIEELNREIKAGTFRRVYFFYGEERYLLGRKVAVMERKMVAPELRDFNRFCFQGRDTGLEAVLEAVEQFPQMSEKKVVLVKNSGFFHQANTKEYKRLKSALQDLPDYTCLIFTEEEFGKEKEKNLKIVEEAGGVVRFDFLPVNRVELWLEDYLGKREKQIYPKDLSYMVRLCGPSLGKLHTECDKLLNYLGQRTRITREDIDAVVDRAAEYRVYDMLNNVIAGRAGLAHEQLQYLKEKRPPESPVRILGKMVEKMTELLLCKQLRECGMPAGEIAPYFDRRAPLFAVNKTIEESRRYGEAYLKRMIFKGLDYDLEIKSGRIDGWTAAELYLAELVKRPERP